MKRFFSQCMFYKLEDRFWQAQNKRQDKSLEPHLLYVKASQPLPSEKHDSIFTLEGAVYSRSGAHINLLHLHSFMSTLRMMGLFLFFTHLRLNSKSFRTWRLDLLLKSSVITKLCTNRLVSIYSHR